VSAVEPMLRLLMNFHRTKLLRRARAWQPFDGCRNAPRAENEL
jgi:hypothetical protein